MNGEWTEKGSRMFEQLFQEGVERERMTREGMTNGEIVAALDALYMVQEWQQNCTDEGFTIALNTKIHELQDLLHVASDDDGD